MATSLSRIRWKRVVIITTFFGLVTALALCKPLLMQKPLPPLAWHPWIGLPPNAADASSFSSREVLFDIQQIESRWADPTTPFDTLVQNCGADDDNPESDRAEMYVVWHADGFIRNPRAWRVAFSVHNDEIKTTVEDTSESMFPPPPPPPGNRSSTANTRERSVFAPKIAVFQKSNLRPIADAWRTAKLWTSPQEETRGCDDAGQEFFEACIHGHYAVRAISCNRQDGFQDEGILKSMRAVLPLPQ